MSTAVVSWSPELCERLEALLGAPVELTGARLLAGGASKEAWAVDVTVAGEPLELLVRRAAGGVIHETATLPLDQEYRVIEAAFAAGVRVPRPYGYLGEIDGREAFATERVAGETIGRRIVTRPEFAGASAGTAARARGRDRQSPCDRTGRAAVPRTSDEIARNEHELDSVGELHPAIEQPGLRRPPRAGRICSGPSSSTEISVIGATSSCPSAGTPAPARLGVRASAATRARTSPGRSCVRGGSAATAFGSAGGRARAAISSATAS